MRPRWPVRIALSTGLMLGSLSCGASHYPQVWCRGVHRQSILILASQAVPSATYIPCIEPMPVGWSYAGSDVRSGWVRFWLDSDRVGSRAFEVTMTAACDLTGSTESPLPNPPSGVRLFEDAGGQQHITVRHYVFPGGCVTTSFSFTRSDAPSIFVEADRLLGLTPRSVYVDGLRNDEGLTLCGAGAPPCPG